MSDDLFISDATYDQLVAKTKTLIARILADEGVDLELKAMLSKAVFLDDLPKKQQASILKHASTGCFPNFDTGLINVGEFGSVWMDTYLRNQAVRIAFDADARTVWESMFLEFGIAAEVEEE